MTNAERAKELVETHILSSVHCSCKGCIAMFVAPITAALDAVERETLEKCEAIAIERALGWKESPRKYEGYEIANSIRALIPADAKENP